VQPGEKRGGYSCAIHQSYLRGKAKAGDVRLKLSPDELVRMGDDAALVTAALRLGASERTPKLHVGQVMKGLWW